MLGYSSSERREGVPEKLGLANRLVLEGPRTSRLLREPLLTRRCRFVQLAVLDLQKQRQASGNLPNTNYHNFSEEARQSACRQEQSILYNAVQSVADARKSGAQCIAFCSSTSNTTAAVTKQAASGEGAGAAACLYAPTLCSHASVLHWYAAVSMR